MRRYEEVARKVWVRKESERYAQKSFKTIISAMKTSSSDVPFFRGEKIKIEGVEEFFNKLEEELERKVGKNSFLYREISRETESILVKKLQKIGWGFDENSPEAYTLVKL